MNLSSVFEEDSYDTDVIVKLWNAGYDLADYFNELRYALNFSSHQIPYVAIIRDCR